MIFQLEIGYFKILERYYFFNKFFLKTAYIIKNKY